MAGKGVFISYIKINCKRFRNINDIIFILLILGGETMKKLLLLGLSSIVLVACNGNQAVENEISSEETSSTTVEKTNAESITSEVESSNLESATTEAAEYYFDGNKVEISDLSMEITDVKIIQPGEPGNEYSEKPVIAFWYNTTNKTDKEIDAITAWIVVFTAIQDNDPNIVNELEVGRSPDEQFLHTQSSTIKNGGTIANAFSYELTDSTTPVTLIATQGIGGPEIGRHDFVIE